MSEDLGGPWKARQESGSRIHGGLGGGQGRESMKAYLVVFHGLERNPAPEMSDGNKEQC